MSEWSFELWRSVLAFTESNCEARAWGDLGRACGKWQMHPDFYDEYYPDAAIRVGMTWDQAFEAALRVFWDRWAGQHPVSGDGAVSLAMRFHVGSAAFDRGVWDRDYERRFRESIVQ